MFEDIDLNTIAENVIMVNSSSSSSEEGNTSSPHPAKGKIQISPAVRWCLTLNNYTESELHIISSIVPEVCKFGIIGTEVGESGTPHLQGYLEFKSKKRPKSVIGIPRIHWEKAKGDRKSNIDYCSKEGNIILKHPKERVIKTISKDMFYAWEHKIIDELQDEPDDRTINWYWSEEGGTGKTSFCKYLVVHEKCIVLGGKASDCRNGIVEYAKVNNGETPERIIINIPRSFDKSYVSYEAFENLKDMIFYSGKYEGGMVCGNCPHLYIFSNFKPDYDKLSNDRWRIFDIGCC